MSISGLEVNWRVDGSMELKRIKIGNQLRHRSTGPSDRIRNLWPTREHVFLDLAFFFSAVDRSQGPIDRSTADLSFCFGGLISTVGSSPTHFIYGILLLLTSIPKIKLLSSSLLLSQMSMAKTLENYHPSHLNLSFY